MPGVGDLTGCGGALGNWGGSGTWSEDAGLTNVQNPGQFVSNVLVVGSPGAANPAEALDYFNALKYLMRDPGMAAIIRRLQDSDTIYEVYFIHDGNDAYLSSTHSVFWDPKSSFLTKEGGCQSAALGLGHELAHADNLWGGFLVKVKIGAGDYENQEEKRVIVGAEAKAAATLGEPRRYDHIYGEARRDPNSTSRTCRP